MGSVRASVLRVLTAAVSLVLALTTRGRARAIHLPGEALAVWG